MKKFFILLYIITITTGAFAQAGKQSSVAKYQSSIEVPRPVVTDDTTFWTISTVSTIGYVGTASGASYNSYKSGGGMIVKFRFKENNRFEFLLYVQANTYGTDTETWTQVEGSVEFGKDAKGQNIFVTKAEKGNYRITKNGRTVTRPVPRDELKGQHSCTYLWERFTFPDDTKNTYLLVVDLEEHPGADVKVQGSINPSWVSKFHIPIKN
ncbi:MAG: hypothetical protein WDN26_17210 [Chitinophagaceae bacterium]